MFGTVNRHPVLGDSLDAHHCVCASCGMVCVEGEDNSSCTVMKLADLPGTIKFKEEAHCRFLKDDTITIPFDRNHTLTF